MGGRAAVRGISVLRGAGAEHYRPAGRERQQGGRRPNPAPRQVPGWRRVFAHTCDIFFARGIANAETREMSSLSVEEVRWARWAAR